MNDKLRSHLSVLLREDIFREGHCQFSIRKTMDQEQLKLRYTESTKQISA